MIDQLAVSDVLLDGTKEIFETMVFMDLEPAVDQNLKIEGDSLLGSITFTGDFEGCITICCNMSCANAIAANMLGLDDSHELAEEEVCDAIGEIANMIMGSVKSRLAGTVDKLDVSIPSVVSGRRLENSLGENSSHTSLKVDIAQEHVAELCILYRKGAR